MSFMYTLSSHTHILTYSYTTEYKAFSYLATQTYLLESFLVRHKHWHYWYSMYSDREPVLCNYTGALHVVACVQVLHAPVYPGCGIHICGLVRHECVEWGLVSTQDRHKYIMHATFVVSYSLGSFL